MLEGIYILGIVLIILIGTACVAGEEGETLSFFGCYWNFSILGIRKNINKKGENLCILNLKI